MSKLGVRPHVTAGAGGFVDITARARKIVFSGFFMAGAKLAVEDGRLGIEKEGKVEQARRRGRARLLLGPRGVEQGQDITYVTERCVMKLTPTGSRYRDRTGRRPAATSSTRRIPAHRCTSDPHHGSGACSGRAARPRAGGGHE